MKCTKTLKLNKDFRRLYYRGKNCVCKNVVIYCMKNRGETNRIGITCGKSVGKAVVRNRLKRLVRETDENSFIYSIAVSEVIGAWTKDSELPDEEKKPKEKKKNNQKQQSSNT